jgi:hypothetical protein
MAKINLGHLDSMRPRGVARVARDDRAPRWVWWYGAAVLLLGGLGLWLHNERLFGLAVSLGFVLFGLGGVKEAVDGLRTGAMKGKWGDVFERDRRPITFWVAVAVYTCLGILLFVTGIQMLVSSLFGTLAR